MHGDFEWDEDKAASNLVKHDVSFEEAAFAMTDPLSLDFNDASASSAPGMRRAKNGDGMKKQNEPSAESLEEMPEIDDQRFRRRPGRGHHASRSAGEIVTIDADLWSHFGSAEAVNDALRRVVVDGKKAAGS